MYRSLGARLDTIEHERGLPGNRIYYLAVPPTMFAPTVAEPGGGAARPPARFAAVRAADRREADWTRSGLGPGDQRRDRLGLRRAADLPHRSLSGQGNGPEHSRAPVRQQHLRTAVQPEVHRSRPDHGGGRRRGRQARGLLRAGGRAARHGAESHPAARRAGGDGAAAIGRRGRRARRKAGGDSVAASDCRRGGRRRRRSGRSMPPASWPGAPVPGYLQEEGVDSAVAHRDLRGAAGVHRQLALGRRAVFPAHRQAAAEARERDFHPLEERAADSVQRQSGDAARSERPVHPHPAQRGICAQHRVEGSRSAGPSVSGQDGLSVRQHVRQAVAGGVRAAAPRRDGRRSDAVHAPGCGRGVMAMGHRHSRRLGRTRRRPAAHLSGRRVGAGRGQSVDRVHRQAMERSVRGVHPSPPRDSSLDE